MASFQLAHYQREGSGKVHRKIGVKKGEENRGAAYTQVLRRERNDDVSDRQKNKK